VLFSIAGASYNFIREQADSNYSHVYNENMNFLFVELVLLGNRKQTKYGEAYDDKFNDNSCKDSSFFVMIAHLFKTRATTRKNPTIWAHTPM
jgi:hypothetical protein